MKPTVSSTNDIPYFVGSYVEANNNYTSGSGIGIASAIYPVTDSDLRSADFPYRQIIRGNGACYLNACLVGILNKCVGKCVGDAEKWQKFKANVTKLYPTATKIIDEIETRAKSDDASGSKRGLDREKLNQMLQEKGEGNLGTQLAKKILIKEHQALIKIYDLKIAQQHQVIEEAESNKIKYTTDYLEAFKRYLQTDDGKKLIDQTLPTFGKNVQDYEKNITIMKEHFKKIHDHQMNPIKDPDQNGPFMTLRGLAGNPSAPVDKTGSYESINKKIDGAQSSIRRCAIYKNYISESNDDFATSYEESMIEPIVGKLTLGMINQGQSLDIHTFEDTYFQNPYLIQNFDPNAIYLHNADGVSHFNLIYSKVDPICTELNEINIQTTKTREDKKIKEQNDKLGLASEIKELENKQKLDDESKEIIKSIIDNKELIQLDLTSLQLIKSIYEASTEKAQESKTSFKKEAQKILSESKTPGDSTKTSTPQDNQPVPEICFQLALEEIIKNNEPDQELFETYLQAIKEGDQATKNEKFQRQLSHTVAKKGKSNFIAPLIKILPDSFKTIECFDNTPLMWAIANAENKFAFDLLTQAQGVDIGINHISEQLGTNALHLATAKGYTVKDCDGNDVGIPNSKLVEKLIENGANPNIETTSGLSALDIGVLRADSKLVELILSSQKIEKHTILKAIRKIDSINFEYAKNKLQQICTVFEGVDKGSFDDKKNIIKQILLKNLHEKFPESVQEQEDKRKTDIIIQKQYQIYKELFDEKRVIKQDKKKSLKDHVGEGMDWWVFPGYTNNNDPDKFTATEEIYTRLARDPEYCKRYKTFIYQYMDSFDIDGKVTHKHRFSKLVESLIGMTSNGNRTLAGFTQKEQDILFIAVDNFYKKQGEKTLIHDINYQKHFQNLERIADESKEIDDKAIWISSARENLRARLELDENQTYSKAIKQRQSNPIFHKNVSLNQEQIDDFNSRLSPYSQSNKNGCGTLRGRIGDEDVSYPFCHFRITHDPIAKKNYSDSNKVKLIDENEYLKYPPITAICIDYPDYRSKPNLPSLENLTKTYKQKTLETLTLYNDLEVDHLVKHGDGMGVFLNQTQINGIPKERGDKIISDAMKAYLDGFFQAVSEFYQTIPNATLKKITFVTLDGKLEKIFNEKLKEFKKDTSNSEILTKVEFKEDKAGPRFNSSKYYEQGTKKLGMTIAPNGDQKFLGGALHEGNVLEEQIALLSDMASIGNPNFNPNVKEIIDLKSLKTSGTPSTTLDISDNYKKTDYEFSDDSKTFYHKKGHIDGMRITFDETIPQDESRRKAGAHHQSGKEHFEVLNDILESVCESANEAGIHDKEKIKEILISAMKKATVKNDESSDKFSKKFSTHFQNKCREKKIFSAQDKKNGLRTKRFGDVFGGVEGIRKIIDSHFSQDNGKLSFTKITQTQQMSAPAKPKGAAK